MRAAGRSGLTPKMSQSDHPSETALAPPLTEERGSINQHLLPCDLPEIDVRRRIA